MTRNYLHLRRFRGTVPVVASAIGSITGTVLAAVRNVLLPLVCLSMLAACSQTTPAQTADKSDQCIPVDASITYNRNRGWQVVQLSPAQFKAALDLVDTGNETPDTGFAGIKGDSYLLVFSVKGCFIGAAKISEDDMQHILGEPI